VFLILFIYLFLVPFWSVGKINYEFIITPVSEGKELVVTEPHSSYRSDSIRVNANADMSRTGFRIDPKPDPSFTNELLKDINKLANLLQKRRRENRKLNTATDVRILNLLSVDTKLGRETLKKIIRQAVIEKAGDLWAKFGCINKGIHVVLGQLQYLQSTDGSVQTIHTDDLHTKCLNFNRQLTDGQSTAFPVPGSPMAQAFEIVCGLDLDEVELENKTSSKTQQITDMSLRTKVSTIPTPNTMHYKDFRSEYVIAGGGSTFWSCIFHTSPSLGVTNRAVEPTGSNSESANNTRIRNLLFHVFYLKDTRMSQRSQDFQYTPVVLSNMKFGNQSNETAETVKDFEKYGINQQLMYNEKL
jgi:hypothetical protein